MNLPFKAIITRPEAFNPFEEVKTFLLDKYSHLDNHLVVLGYNVHFDYNDLKKKYPGYKIVIYQLEQLFDNKSFWYNKKSTHQTIVARTLHCQKCLNQCDEIWDYDLDNIAFMKKEGFTKPMKFVPLMYTDKIKRGLRNPKPVYDVVFYGSLNDRRVEILKEIDKKFNLLVISSDKPYKFKNTKPTVFGAKLFEEVFNAKIVLNLHFYEGFLQEQVRIFELLCNNVCVVSEKSRKNYYGNLIFEETADNLVKKIQEVLEKGLWKRDVVTNFKNFDQNLKKDIKIGAIYNSFYNVELLEESIRSIRDICSHIVVVHQKKSYSGIPENVENEAILQNLVKDKLIDKIIYYDKIINAEVGCVEKRNIGLIELKEMGCEYVIPMDNDELYDQLELLSEIRLMKEENIDTLYSPIFSYYYSRDYRFLDTYYVPSVYKVDERIFESAESIVLCDPNRKMLQKNYKISKVPMHHYTYFKKSYSEKLNLATRCVENGINSKSIRIYQYLKMWHPGKQGLVFFNDLSRGGAVDIHKVTLEKLN